MTFNSMMHPYKIIFSYYLNWKVLCCCGNEIQTPDISIFSTGWSSDLFKHKVRCWPIAKSASMVPFFLIRTESYVDKLSITKKEMHWNSSSSLTMKERNTLKMHMEYMIERNIHSSEVARKFSLKSQLHLIKKTEDIAPKAQIPNRPV